MHFQLFGTWNVHRLTRHVAQNVARYKSQEIITAFTRTVFLPFYEPFRRNPRAQLLKLKLIPMGRFNTEPGEVRWVHSARRLVECNYVKNAPVQYGRCVSI